MKHGRYRSRALWECKPIITRAFLSTLYDTLKATVHLEAVLFLCSDYDTAKHAFYFSLEPKDLAKKLSTICLFVH